MAKNKRTINDIQKALHTSTKYIKKADDTDRKVETPEKADKSSRPEVVIDPVVLKKIKILSPYLGETPEETINKALNHFLRLKSMQLEKAMQKLTEE
ncbi:MAG: hypothetical protein ACLFNU_12025 [Bacteroidales bacterium]